MTNHDMDAEERDVLDRFERGELRPAPDANREAGIFCQTRMSSISHKYVSRWLSEKSR